MATRQSIDDLIARTTACISEAEEQLDITNRNGYSVDADYSEAQAKLTQMEAEIAKLMDSSNAQQREQLHRLHLLASQCLNDMILDQNDLAGE
ncbi:DUF2524 family protein [Sediminibacillus dalangtanensis]|uniref:DUF2524 family protein n=1 Tax=Sediminibacillus dalangtanensis TaxID=2729421 RepID=A0ABX7VZH1_9BACI|nr:DUF2524 family protein [Sediminibacillus dalangtanensis]QTN00137.1 DUF2524 family protein [Sediminibacillus dalangtanensis]